MKKLLILIFYLGFSNLQATDVIDIKLSQICKPPYVSNAILRQDPLFIDDFVTIHSLLRMANPRSVFEIGTCTGEGTLIIKNAVENNIVYSLELPLGQSSYDIGKIGGNCFLPYTQVIGNSLTINYADFYPIEAWFIDGEHDYTHVLYETKQALLSNPNLIIWHDSDIPEVLEGIKDGLNESGYVFFRVIDTRIGFSVPKNSKILGLIYE